MYSPCEGIGASLVGSNSSKPVPPVGKRTNRFVIAAVLCEPGRKDRAPFSGVHFSRANQKPKALGGSVYYGRDRYSRLNPNMKARKLFTRKVLFKSNKFVSFDLLHLQWPRSLTSRCAPVLIAKSTVEKKFIISFSLTVTTEKANFKKSDYAIP